MKKLRVAVIGCGRICVMHFDAIENIDSVELVACCDIVKSKADFYAKKYNVKAYYDYKEMLDNEKLDSIHICLPHYLHTIVAEYAFSKGVNVLSEKPMSIDYQSAVNAVECAKKHNVLSRQRKHVFFIISCCLKPREAKKGSGDAVSRWGLGR